MQGSELRRFPRQQVWELQKIRCGGPELSHFCFGGTGGDSSQVRSIELGSGDGSSGETKYSSLCVRQACSIHLPRVPGEVG